MSRKRTVKRGKFTNIVEPQILQDVVNDPEGSLRLAALLDEAQELTAQRQIAQAVHPEVKLDALIEGKSQTTEQQIARRLVFGDGKLGRKGSLPPDRFRGEDLRVRQLGVDGQIKPDSVVAGGTTANMVDDVVNVQRNGVLTEFLSPMAEEKLFREWSQLNPGEGRDKFNADLSEYYGQQILRTVGAQPVNDADRSDKVKENVRMNYEDGEINPRTGRRMSFRERLPASESTAGTDRLVENSVGLLSRDIDLSGDFRYMMDGQVRVGDNQTGEPRDTVRLNLLKAALGPGTDTNSLQANWSKQSQILQSIGVQPTTEKIIESLVAQGKLPPIKQGSQGRGIRAGKAMSSSPMFRDQNKESQFRYDDILFAHTEKDLRDKPRGYIPSDVVLVDARKAGDALGLMPSTIYSHQGSVNATPKIKDLIAAGAAQRLSDDPRVKQLLP